MLCILRGSNGVVYACTRWCKQQMDESYAHNQLLSHLGIKWPTRWITSPVGCYQVNVDAIVLLPQCGSGQGCVIWNHIGEVIDVIADRKIEIMLLRVAKLWAIWYGLNFNLDIGFQNIILEFDCLQTVQMVNKK